MKAQRRPVGEEEKSVQKAPEPALWQVRVLFRSAELFLTARQVVTGINGLSVQQNF